MQFHYPKKRLFVALFILTWMHSVTLWAQDKSTSNADANRATALIERARKEKSSAWLEDKKLVFYYRGDAKSVTVRFVGGTKALKRLPNSDVWTYQATLPDLESGIVSYTIVAEPNAQNDSPQNRRTFQETWRGPQAPPTLRRSATLSGQVEHHTLDSPSLGEQREVSVYLPAADKPAQWVVYMSDGQSVDGYASIVDGLIESGELPSLAIVGTHSAVYQGQEVLEKEDLRRNVRALEYVPSLDPARFASHEVFFTEEVRAWAEKAYALPTESTNRIVFGFSNGGSFAATMGLRHPELYGNVIACAAAGDRYEIQRQNKLTNHFYLITGKWDKPFHENVLLLHRNLTRARVHSSIVIRAAAHDGTMWEEEFVNALKAISK